MVSSSDISHAHGSTEVPLLDATIGEHLRRTVGRFDERDALIVPHQGFRATYGELRQQVDRAARALMAHGVRQGDRVGIWAPNRYEWVITQFATARVGAILVTINPAYKAGRGGVCAAPGRGQRAGGWPLVFASRTTWRCLTRFGAGCPELRDRDRARGRLGILPRRRWTHRGLRTRRARGNAPRSTTRSTSSTRPERRAARRARRSPIRTSSTTPISPARALGYSEHDRVCVPVPFYHCFGMVLATLACATHGACVVVPGESFEPTAVLEAVAAERCTSLYGVPTMFIAELEELSSRDLDLSSLRTGVMGGAPCPVGGHGSRYARACTWTRSQSPTA